MTYKTLRYERIERVGILTFDTPERLNQWLSAFPVDVVGLTGTIDQLEAAQEAAGVTAAIAEAPDANGKYVVGHSSAMNVYTAVTRSSGATPRSRRLLFPGCLVRG